MPAAIGLRHPASASCLGRHLRLAGRCPNNSSLLPPLAAVVVVALWAFLAENHLIFREPGTPAGVPGSHFHRRGRRGKRHLQRRFLRKRGAAVSVLALSVFALQIHLSQRERPWHSGTVSGLPAKLAVSPEALPLGELASPIGLD